MPIWPTRTGLPPWRAVALIAAVLVALAAAANAAGVAVADLPWALGEAAASFGELFGTPDTAYLPNLAYGLLETLEIAFAATMFAMLLSAPLSLLAAHNATPHPAAAAAARGGVGLVRALPELIWAVVFVKLTSLGPTAAVLALSLVGTSILTKFYAESLEVVPAGPVEGVRAHGAGWLQLRAVGVVPQAGPDWLAATLYLLDHNVRAATVVGVVGGGGLGYDIEVALKQGQPERLILIIAALFAAVSAIDYLSSRVRARVI